MGWASGLKQPFGLVAYMHMFDLLLGAICLSHNVRALRRRGVLPPPKMSLKNFSHSRSRSHSHWTVNITHQNRTFPQNVLESVVNTFRERGALYIVGVCAELLGSDAQMDPQVLSALPIR